MTPAAPDTVLSSEQQAAFDLAVRGGAHLFLTGRAGTGKTTVTRAILRALGSRAAVLAPTGVAAMTAGGQTLHSFFNLPPRLILPQDVRRSRNGRAMRALTTLVIDEISMVRADLMAAVDASLRLNRGSNAPFGGVRMVVAGDLAQLPPVIRGEEAAHLEDVFGGPFFFHAPAFREAGFTLVELNEVRRQDDSDFIDILNAVREGELDREQADQLNARVSGRSGLQASETHVVLTATNQSASAINQARLDALVGEPRGFAGKVEGDFDARLFPTEDPLILKTGARVMLIRNDPAGRYVNGSIGEVTGFADGAVIVRVHGESVRVEPVSWERTRYAAAPDTEGGLKRETVGAYVQYPLRLAWAMTIHKAQGLTLERVYLDVSRRLFAHGQAYVALSRARSLAGLELSAPLRAADIITDPRLFDVRSVCDPVPFALRG
ncbi:AAA family ATPase [Alkalicaulis satelles]|uniref:AAA family ATPase n=1 Tax=Alkalicaulis satelles TaxID=2609175 RepID=A0A5M6ZHS6_9PROT|nr:DEAD/DEAH box helicase [Alkalicaulis satelles]KAA5803850.1 AAA family ATPase [Alkalicaulis satelles]